MTYSPHTEILAQGVAHWNKWRADNPFIIPDLTNINLSSQNLSGIDFSNVDLSYANLSQTDLSHSNLFQVECYEADMTNAILVNCSIRGGKFHNSILRGATLKSSNLFRVDFVNTILENTDFDGCICATTAFSNVDISASRNLGNIIHKGPSNIDILTIYQSIEKASNRFFIDAGVPGDFLRKVKDLVIANPIKYYSCFISYSHSDKVFAKRLYSTLSFLGIACWLDEFKIKPGEKIYDAVNTGIHNWDKILLCCSKSSLNSWWVNDELSKALTKEQRLWKERGKETLAIIPIDLDGFLFEWEGALANQLRDRYALSCQNWEKDEQKFKSAVNNLLNALKVYHDNDIPKSYL